MKVLGLESTCDETSAAVIQDSKILSNVISSQSIHHYFGGIVPELASRMHIQIISKVVSDALKKANISINEIDGISVAYQPGLVGSLVVGTNFAKGLALRFAKPLVPVDHIEGHIFSGFLEKINVPFPFLSLVVSGGHTALFLVNSVNSYEMIGSTRDDAAGEAFDKIGKLIGLEYPAGPKIDKLAQNGNPKKYQFPRALIKSNDFDFSFSGLKTAVRYFIERNFPNGIPENELYNLCASVQEAIVDVLLAKCEKAIYTYNISTLVIAGGVSANTRLRELAKERLSNNVEVIIPQMQYCMDNAAMIALIGELKLSESGSLESFLSYEFKANPTPKRARRN